VGCTGDKVRAGRGVGCTGDVVPETLSKMAKSKAGRGVVRAKNGGQRRGEVHKSVGIRPFLAHFSASVARFCGFFFQIGSQIVPAKAPGVPRSRGRPPGFAHVLTTF